MVAAANFKRDIGRNLLPRLVDPRVARKSETGKDQRLRAGAAFGEATIDEQLIGAQFGH